MTPDMFDHGVSCLMWCVMTPDMFDHGISSLHLSSYTTSMFASILLHLSCLHASIISSYATSIMFACEISSCMIHVMYDGISCLHARSHHKLCIIQEDEWHNSLSITHTAHEAHSLSPSHHQTYTLSSYHVPYGRHQYWQLPGLFSKIR